MRRMCHFFLLFAAIVAVVKSDEVEDIKCTYPPNGPSKSRFFYASDESTDCLSGLPDIIERGHIGEVCGEESPVSVLSTHYRIVHN